MPRGVDQADADAVATEVRTCYPAPEAFQLYDDSIEALGIFRDAGWRQAIVSNHCPHDRNVSREEAIGEGLIDGDLFDRIAAISFDLFARGTEVAAERGLILVDTKYEFGLVDGEIILVDEVHTPDSSRFWYADTYDELFAAGKDQRALDKEPLREWFVERGFRGDGPAPAIPDDVRIATASRYIALAEEITQRPFQVTPETARDRVMSLLAP